MILFLTMMILMTFAIWFVQFCALIIHCHFCHGQVCTLQWGSNTTGAGDRFFMTIILLLMLSVPNIGKRRYYFTFYLSNTCFHRFHFSVQSRGQHMLVATWPSWIAREKVHGKAREIFLRKNTWKGHLIRVPFPQLPNISKQINYVMSTTRRVQLILHKNFHAANSSFYLYRTTQIVNKTENVIQTRGDMIDMIKIIFLDESSAMSQIGRQPTAIVQHGF